MPYSASNVFSKQQQSCGSDIAGAGDNHQCRLAQRIGGVHIYTGLQQQSQHLDVAGDGYFRQGRGAIVIGLVDGRTGFKQPRHLLHIVVVHGP